MSRSHAGSREIGPVFPHNVFSCRQIVQMASSAVFLTNSSVYACEVQAGRYVQYALTPAFTKCFGGAEKSTDALAFWKSLTVVVNAKTHAESGGRVIV